MLRQLLQLRLVQKQIFQRCSSDATRTVSLIQQKTISSELLDDLDKTFDQLGELKEKDLNHPLLPAQNEEYAIPIVVPSFNLASFVNKSEVLREMVKLGVAIYEWDKKPDVQGWILKKNFDSDVKPVIQFLVDSGIDPNNLGKFLTTNPMILKETICDLETRINYLKSKRFNQDQISKICTRNPHWLLYSTQRIDTRLGFFQQVYSLSMSEIRQIAAKEPRLITSKLANVKEMNFAFLEEMGFEKLQIKTLLLAKPKLWIMNRHILVERFDYLHNVIKMDHDTIVTFPAVLTCRDFRLRERHQFLRFLGRHQYNPKEPNYVSPLDLIRGTDAVFACNVAKSSVLEFNDFCKTL
nr:EOG090X0C5Y [Sida crystallina]